MEHLYARTPVFIGGDDLKSMLGTIAAIEALCTLTPYQDEIFSRSHIGHKTSARGLFMGYDFHITPDGPKLIEVNTNAGGAFLVSNLLRAIGPNISCCWDSNHFNAVLCPDSIDDFMADMFVQEWQTSTSSSSLKIVAIVDENPKAQYLYPEMLLAKNLLAKHKIKTVIIDPGELVYKQGKLYAGTHKIDLVYNRLTDFDLSGPRHMALRSAYEECAVVLSPAPDHHALFADKRNLILFGNTEKLANFGLMQSHINALNSVPKTLMLTPENADEMWTKRKQYFFKPKDGFGSRAAYRGSKITRKVWAQISGGTHVAQEFIPPSVRRIALEDGPVHLKFDLRVYTYAGQAFAMAARVYQGQTTNFRTKGGGFAPVIYL